MTVGKIARGLILGLVLAGCGHSVRDERRTLVQSLSAYQPSVAQSSGSYQFDYYVRAMREIIPSLIAKPFHFAGVSFQADGDFAYAGEESEIPIIIIDGRLVPESTLGQTWLRVTRGPGVAAVLLNAKNNCIATTNIVVCDSEFLWKHLLIAERVATPFINSPRQAATWALGPGLDASLQALRNAGDWTARERAVRDASKASGDDEQPDGVNMALQAFASFIFSHEVAHITLKHTEGNRFAPCAFAGLSGPTSQGLDPVLLAEIRKKESDADAHALAAMVKYWEDLGDGNFSRELLATVMLWGIYLSSTYEAALDNGHSLTEMGGEAAQDPQLRESLRVRICGLSHPPLLRRYQAMIRLLPDNQRARFSLPELQGLWGGIQGLAGCEDNFDAGPFLQSLKTTAFQ